MATAGAIGCNLGSAVAYWIGAKGGRPLVERYGRWVLMSHHDLDRMTYFFEKYGSITVLVARLLPVVRTFIAFPAGIAKMPQLRFHIYTFVGSWPWCFVLAYAGMKLGEKWHTDPRFEQAFHRFHLVVELALVAAVRLVCVVAPERGSAERTRPDLALNVSSVSTGTISNANRMKDEKHSASEGRLGEAMANEAARRPEDRCSRRLSPQRANWASWWLGWAPWPPR